MLIVFSGTDGSGKSTQIEALNAWLGKTARWPKLLWARGGYTPGFLTLKRLLRWASGRQLPSAGDFVKRKEAFARAWVRDLWLRVAISDLMVYWGVYLRLQRLLGRVVICDRYIDDTRLDFRRSFPMVAFEQMWLWQMLERVVPTPDAAFLLWVPVGESMRRSREKGEPFPDDEDTLAWRLKQYKDESLFPSARYVRLDGRRSVTEISEEIGAVFRKRFGKRV